MAANWQLLQFSTPLKHFPYTAKFNCLFIISSNILFTQKPVAQKLQDMHFLKSLLAIAEFRHRI
jgi:hypothetical protein